MTSARCRGLLITSGSSQLQVGERLGGEPGLLAAVVGEVEVGAAGVPAGLRPLGLAVAQQQQAVPFGRSRRAILPHGPARFAAATRTSADASAASG